MMRRSENRMAMKRVEGKESPVLRIKFENMIMMKFENIMMIVELVKEN